MANIVYSGVSDVRESKTVHGSRSVARGGPEPKCIGIAIRDPIKLVIDLAYTSRGVDRARGFRASCCGGGV